jgi:hypothetical protein
MVRIGKATEGLANQGLRDVKAVGVDSFIEGWVD